MRKYAIGAVAVLLPALALYPAGSSFVPDWSNHVWMVGYFGEYIRQHGSVPTVVNTAEIGGITFPLFYGYLFYPLLGLASTHLHPEIVVRCAALLILVAQYLSVRKTARRLQASEGLASGLACLSVWSIYGLTNLYNRAALTEFFAVGVLTCAVCSWFDLLQSTTPGRAWRRGLRFGLQLTLAIGFHPLTGLFSLPLLVVLAFALPGRRVAFARLVPVGAATAAAAVLVLASWVYAIRTFEKDLAIASVSTEVVDFTAHIDHWRTRLYPLPYDPRCVDRAPEDVSTPYLDAQINLPLLGLAAVLTASVWRRLAGTRSLPGEALAAVPLLYALATLYLSLGVQAFEHLPRVFKKVQFLYRLVSFVNLGFLLVPLFLLQWAARRQSAGAPCVTVSPMWLSLALIYSAVCVTLKLEHAQAAQQPPAAVVKDWADAGRVYHHPHTRWFKNNADRVALSSLPKSSYGHGDYSTPKHLPSVSAAEIASMKVQPFGSPDGSQLSESQTMRVAMERAGHVATNTLVFPWTQFEVDGQVIPSADLRAWHHPHALLDPYCRPWTVVPVPAGAHTVSHRFVPDPMWLWLDRVSWAVLISWLMVVGGMTVASLVRVRRTSAVPPTESTAPIPIPCAA